MVCPKNIHFVPRVVEIKICIITNQHGACAVLGFVCDTQTLHAALGSIEYSAMLKNNPRRHQLYSEPSAPNDAFVKKNGKNKSRARNVCVTHLPTHNIFPSSSDYRARAEYTIQSPVSRLHHHLAVFHVYTTLTRDTKPTSIELL